VTQAVERELKHRGWQPPNRYHIAMQQAPANGLSQQRICLGRTGIPTKLSLEETLGQSFEVGETPWLAVARHEAGR